MKALCRRSIDYEIKNKIIFPGETGDRIWLLYQDHSLYG